MTTSSNAARRRPPGLLLVTLGLALAALGIIGYAAQVAALRLTTPWYLPLSATLGVLCVVVALWQGRTVWRVLALVLVLLLAAGEWAFLLGTRLPAYTGPVAEGKPFPAFTTSRADGTTFTQNDLRGDRNHVFVFFRGRW
jgi:hypothetical protein